MKKLTPVPFEDATWNKVRGKCVLCGTEITSATGQYCWVCYKKCLRHCPVCTNLNGIVLRKYQRHKGMAPGVICNRCEVIHTDDRQLKCERCNGDRVIFVLPETLEKVLEEKAGRE